MRVHWRFVIEWGFIAVGMVAFAAFVLVLTYGDRKVLHQAAHALGYNLADAVLGPLLPK
jgi:hypothetical protein